MATTTTNSDQSTKLAIAMALLRSKLLHQPPQAPPLPLPPSSSSRPSPSMSDAHRWKRKAKDRKLQIQILKQQLKDLEDGLHCDLYPQSASCKCHFFDELGKSSLQLTAGGSDDRISDVLRRRFLRQVRLKERRKRRSGDSVLSAAFSECNSEDEIEQLRISVDFLVDLCNKDSLGQGTNFANLVHQAVDFILGSLNNLLSMDKGIDVIEAYVCSLIGRLIRKMSMPLQHEQNNSEHDMQFYVQHLLRKLGSLSFVGQRVLFAACQRISEFAEILLFLDPFDDSFPVIHDSMYVMIQLIEFMVADHLQTWAKNEALDNMFFEEWVKSVAHVRKALELLGSKGAIYVLYMDRVIGELARQVGRISTLQSQNPNILRDLFC